MAYKSPARIFDSHTSLKKLHEVYGSHVIDGTSRGRDGMHAQALEDDLSSICRFVSKGLRSGEHRFIQYREITYSKGAGKYPRVVSIPAARDRVALKALANFLGDVFPEATGELPQVFIRGVADALKEQRLDAYIRLDVREFYPSIPHHLVESELRRRIKREEIVSVLMRSIRTPTVPLGQPKRRANRQGVPQGLAVSNILAELVMRPVDREFGATGAHRYFRFVDDILILCESSDVEMLDKSIRNWIADRELEVHPREEFGNKSRVGLVADGFSYLGYEFHSDRISIRDSSVHSLEARIAGEFTKYKHSRRKDAFRVCRWRVNLAITGCIYNNRASGWLPYYRQMNDLKLLKELDATVQALISRFNMPAHFQVKSFMRAYWATVHPSRQNIGYIPRLDGLTVRQMRAQLEQCLGAERIEEVADEDIRRLFRKTMNRVTSELEQDVGDVS